MSVVEVWIQNLDCEGCASKIRKAIRKLDGVDDIDIDMDAQKVTVSGHAIEEKKVLKAVRRAGKAAEPWPFPSYSHFSSFYKYPTHITNHYYDMSCDNSASVHTFFHTPSTYSVTVASDEAVASLFSDENPHACTIM
ncbi:copper transport protein ATX1 [Cinnamomum micranthum f. kanehirae]|uniref:Copper transport protein ATX1 n=1 Tax=Cinnamomum micranthum f. kanehirae TaxID=337451 RepID=A0A443N0W5_9MAGN|nr:copper transport protein ATX1 [Cinnamomum micranthum f. kanehirae]